MRKWTAKPAGSFTRHFCCPEVFSQLNRKGIHYVQDPDKSAVFSLGLVTLSVIYQVFRAKIDTPEFKNQLSPEELDELIFDVEFDLVYNREAGSVDADYLGGLTRHRHR